MKKNKQFFDGKTWEEVFRILKFDRHLEKLKRKLRGKSIALYGAGIMCDYIMDNYDVSGLDVKIVADKKFKVNNPGTYRGFSTIGVQNLKRANVDVILITSQFPYIMLKYLKKEVFKEKKLPKVYFILNKPIDLYIEEIFSN